MLDNFRNDIKIDRYNLDDEWENNPNTYLYWGEKLAEAEYERDILKDALELREAELAKQIRLNPKDFDLKKITDKAINEVVLTHSDYRELKKRYIRSIKDAKVLLIAEKAFWHKQKSLDRLTDLWVEGFWGKTSYQSPARNYSDSRDEERQRKILNENRRFKKED